MSPSGRGNLRDPALTNCRLAGKAVINSVATLARLIIQLQSKPDSASICQCFEGMENRSVIYPPKVLHTHTWTL